MAAHMAVVASAVDRFGSKFVTPSEHALTRFARLHRDRLGLVRWCQDGWDRCL